MPEYIFCTTKKYKLLYFNNNKSVSSTHPFIYKLVKFYVNISLFIPALFIPKLKRILKKFNINMDYLHSKTYKAHYDSVDCFILSSKNILMDIQKLSKIFKSTDSLINNIVRVTVHEDLHKAITHINKYSGDQEFIIEKIGY